MNAKSLLPLSWALAALLPSAVAIAQPRPQPPPAAPADSGVFVSQETLDAYVGRYVVSPGLEVRVWRQGEQLMLQATGQPAWPLQGISETVFRVQAVDAKVTFLENAAGLADQLVLLMDGRETKAIRK
jgi:hypothetical protein